VFEGYQSAVRDAYLRAFDGLRRDATAQHGHGVVGVAVNRRWLPGAQSVLEVTARGSVIRHGESPGLEEPFLSVLSSSDFAALLAGGCVPCGVAFGYAVLHAHAFTMWPPGITAVSSSVNQRQWDNVELEGLTTAVQHARRIAEQHLRADLAAHGADGAVGVAVSVELRDSPCAQGPGRLIEVTALGTAVTRFGPAANDIDVRLTFDSASRGTL
jgi:uncharacterized protein YbjQ (UPF0145 family)